MAILLYAFVLIHYFMLGNSEIISFKQTDNSNNNISVNMNYYEENDILKGKTI